jgi:uncharacterized protein HemY
MGKILIIVGGILILAGLILQYSKHLPFIGRLPGDVVVERQSYKIYFPVATSILLSILLSVIVYLINKFRN